MNMKKIGFLMIALMAVACKPCCEHVKNELRAPAYPLITIDPYTSAWSAVDNLYDGPVTHWTGAAHHLLGVVKVDGVTYRFLGALSVNKKYLARVSDKTGWDASYTLKKPSGNWMNPGFDDSKWTKGQGGFGSQSKKPIVHTIWDGPEIWVRRTFVSDQNMAGKDVELYVKTNEYGTIYINGTKVCDADKTSSSYVKLSDEIASCIVEGENVIAAYCANPTGSAHLDFAIVENVHSEEQYETTAQQLYADVQAMNTHYGFTCGPVELSVSFLAPLFLDDLDLISRPVNYMSYEVKSLDGKKHHVEVMLEATPA